MRCHRRWVTEAIEHVCGQFSFPILGIDSDWLDPVGYIKELGIYYH